MHKFLYLAVLMSLTLGVALNKLVNYPTRCTMEILEAFITEYHVQQKYASHQQFKEVFQATLLDLRKKELSLAEATVRVYHAAKMFEPVYLEILPYSDPASTLELSVANNLVGHFQDLASNEPRLESTLKLLEMELRVMTMDRPGIEFTQ